MSGRKADVIKAAHLCAEAALRLVKPGNQVSDCYEAKCVWARGEELKCRRCLCHALCAARKACDLAWEESPSDVGNVEAAVCRRVSTGLLGLFWQHLRLPCGTPALPVPWWLRREAWVLPLASPFLAGGSWARTAGVPLSLPLALLPPQAPQQP